MKKVFLGIGVGCFILFSCHRIIAPPPKIDYPRQKSDFISDPALYCEIVNINDDPAICRFIVLFPDGTVLSSYNSFSLTSNKDYLLEYGHDIYEKYKGLGWGRYLEYGDTLFVQYAEFINMGGALHYDLYEKKFVILNKETLLFKRTDSDEKAIPPTQGKNTYIRIDSVDVSLLNPDKAWINRK